MTIAPNPAADLVLGNPLQGGCNIAFSTCQHGTMDWGYFPFVLLYTISFRTTSMVTNHQIAVRAHSTPNNPNFICPLFTQCDANYTLDCVTGREAYFNHVCVDAVAPATWSKVKALFR